MSTIRNNNTTGGGMYAPSQGINTALSNPNGITGVRQTNGAGGFSGNAEHFYTGPLNSTPPAPAPAPAPVEPLAPQMGGQIGINPEDNYKSLIASGCLPKEAAKHAINGTTPPGIPSRPQRGGQYDTTNMPSGPMGVISGGPIGNNLLNSWNGGRQGGYGYGQGSNVSMLQALMGGGGQGYGDFLSQLLARYGQ